MEQRIKKISAETKRLRKLSKKRQDERSRHAAKIEAAEQAGWSGRCAYMLSWAKLRSLGVERPVGLQPKVAKRTNYGEEGEVGDVAHDAAMTWHERFEVDDMCL